MKDSIKKKLAKIVPFILVGVMASSSIFLSYDKGNEVKAVAGVDDIAVAGLITALLMSYGYVTLDYYNNTDGANALADDWEEAYEQARFKVLNGGGAGDNDDDDNDDFEDTDGDGKITEKDIPKFNQLYNPTSGASALGATFLITANAGKLLAPIVSSFIYDKFGLNRCKKDVQFSSLKKGREELNSYISDNNIDISSYPYFVVSYNYGTSDGVSITTNEISYRYCSSGYKSIDNNWTSLRCDGGIEIVVDLLHDKVEMRDSPYGGSSFQSDYPLYYYTNLPLKNNNSVSWTTPDIGDGFDTKGNLELLPPPHLTDVSSYNIPTQQALQDLLNNLNNPDLLPEQQQQTLLDFINNLANKNPVTDPDKDPDKDPSTDPDKDPDKDPSTDPDKDPDKDPSTDPDKDPDKDPSTDPDKDPDKDPSTDPDTGKFTADLKTLFPFCIPFDIVDCFRLFNAEPETPRVEIPIHFGIVDKDYTFVIDLKDFDNVALILRSTLLISFVVGLGLATRNLIKW